MRRFAILSFLLLFALPLWAQGPAKTTITDTIYNSDGSVFTGKVRIFNSRFTSTGGYTVTQNTLTESVTSGAFADDAWCGLLTTRKRSQAFGITKQIKAR